MGGIAGAITAGTISLGTQGAAAAGLRSPPMSIPAECAKNASFLNPPKFVVSILVLGLLFLSNKFWAINTLVPSSKNIQADSCDL